MLLKQAKGEDTAVEPRTAASALLPMFVLTIVNPMTFVVFAGIVPQLPVAGSIGRAAGLAFALAAGSAAVQIAVTAVAATGILVFGIYGLMLVAAKS